MLFIQKINLLFSELDLSNAAVARASELDPSLISRFRTGTRVPIKNSKQLHALCVAIVTLCNADGNIEKLFTLCKSEPTNDDNRNIMILYEWLNADDSLQRKKRNDTYQRNMKNNDNQLFKDFGTRLGLLMNELNITNIRLARYLDIDASLISRYRSGLRTPPPNSKLLDNLSEYFTTYVKLENKIRIVLNLLNIDVSTFAGKDSNLIYTYIHDWLSGESDARGQSLFNGFLEKFDSFSISEINNPQIKETNFSDRNIENEYFWGTDGMREAVVHFLSCALRRKLDTPIYMYYDQNIDWLIGDIEYSKLWYSLIYALIANGNTIKIIHNIERTPEEMIKGIEHWLPLYMTGKIEPLYCKKALDPRFSHTIFLIPNMACIKSCCVMGTESEAGYLYSTDETLLNFLKRQYDTLLSYCEPLVQIYAELTSEKYLMHYMCIEQKNGLGKTLKSSPSLSTMPLKTLLSILDNNSIFDIERENILRYHEYRSQLIRTFTTNQSLIEMAFIPEDGSTIKHVRIDVPNYIYPNPIYYDKISFSQHMNSIVNEITNNSRYTFIPIHGNFFPNIMIFAKHAGHLIIVKNDTPSTAFAIKHPVLCDAFERYIDTISENGIIPSTTTLTETTLVLQKYMF